MMKKAERISLWSVRSARKIYGKSTSRNVQFTLQDKE
jgi:hypothetical protein